MLYNVSQENPILKTDSYKVSHYRQYPPETEYVHSYFESRGNSDPAVSDVVFFGLRAIIKEHLRIPTISEIQEAEQVFHAHFGDSTLFNKKDWMDISALGYLPIRISALAEGSVVPTHTPLFVVENTDPRFPWLTNYVETILSQVWYPTTIASHSFAVRRYLKQEWKETSDELDGSAFQLHDFGYRGVSSNATAGIGGGAHLTSFKGTDTLAAIAWLQKWYKPLEMPGFSIPATEHSTMTAWGPQGEMAAIANLLREYPKGLVSCVADSWDVREFVNSKIGATFHNQIIHRDGRFIVRPDSGDPKATVMACLSMLWTNFGGYTNSKGYMVLDPRVRLIQGDGVDFAAIRDILLEMKVKGFSSENIAFGSGGGLLQKFDRDYFKFALKCSNVTIRGKDEPVWKAPSEYDAEGNYSKGSFKSSKSGRQDAGMELVYQDGYYVGQSWPFENILKRIEENL